MARFASVFWQTQKAARSANPGARIPRARALAHGFQISVDTRERYPYRFGGKDVETERVALVAGDYAVRSDEALLAAVERKTLENLVSCLSDGTLAFQIPAPLGAPSCRKRRRRPLLGDLQLEHVSGAWIADALARLQVRYPEVQVVFADSRRFAEEWTYRFLASALSDATASSGEG